MKSFEVNPGSSFAVHDPKGILIRFAPIIPNLIFTVVPAAALPPVALFSQLRHFGLGSKKLELSYFFGCLPC